jgi:hypothetical protein
MKILLMTTCILDSNTLVDLKRLVDSIKNASDLFFEHVFLLQGNPELTNYDLSFLADNNNYIKHIIYNEGVISLSSARNIMIKYSYSNNLYDDVNVVSFPDDDCWYPKGSLEYIKSIFTNNNEKVIYTRYGSLPSSIDNVPFTNNHSIKNLVSYASSNTTFYDKGLFTKIGIFDERFGVGGTYNGGEDTDFAIRALVFNSFKSFFFIDFVLVGHREPNPIFRYKYFNGSLRVLKIHSSNSFNLKFMYIRKLLVGFIYLLSRKISFIDLITK